MNMNGFDCEDFRKRVLTLTGTDYSPMYCDGKSFTSDWVETTSIICDTTTRKVYHLFVPEKITNVEFYPPAVKMTFNDGTVTTSVAQGDDEYNPEQGMIMCILQYIFMGKTYNNMFRKWIKADEDRKAAIEKEALAEKEAKEITARQEAKEQKRKAKRAARKREEAIEIQKEAYLRAMKETSNKEEV